jgi:hypothetical protein
MLSVPKASAFRCQSVRAVALELVGPRGNSAMEKISPRSPLLV